MFGQGDVLSLREILDSGELKNSVSEEPPRDLIHEGTVTRLSIPRDGKTQQIAVWKYFDSRGMGAARIPGTVEHGTSLVRPLNEWLKTSLQEEKETATTDPRNPQCLLEH